MAVGKEVRGPLWVDGQLTVRVRGPGPEPGRVVRVRRPFALIGQLPGADIRIDDPAIDGRHAFLLLDRRGIFGVDLLTRTGTRFGGAACGSAWLGAGGLLEIAGRRVELLQLRVDGSPIDPPPSDVDLLADSGPSELADLTLVPLDSPGQPWRLGSALGFVGRGEACAIQIENASVSKTHCALLRGHTTAYIIDLLGRLTLINGRPIEGASALLDGDILTIGQARFAVCIDRPAATSRPTLGPQADAITGSSMADGMMIDERSQIMISSSLDHRPIGHAGANSSLVEPFQRSQELVLRPRETMFAMLLGAAESGRDSSRNELFDMLRQFQADTASLLEAQVERIEALNREIEVLREEIRGRGLPRALEPPPATPLRLDLKSPQGTPSEDSATWLLDRLNTLETETRSTWKDLLGRFTSTVAPRTQRDAAPPDQIPPPIGPETPPDEKS